MFYKRKNSADMRLAEHPLMSEPFVLAFSGGADSSLLAAEAARLNPGGMTAVTCITPYIPQWEVDEAEAFAREHGFRWEKLELDFPDFLRDNPEERCYLCKKHLFGLISRFAESQGIKKVADGTNLDDLSRYRPGLQALKELEVVSPLAECGITKSGIHRMAAARSLSTAGKPPYACMLTRFPHRFEIHERELRMVEAGEKALMDAGEKLVRVRVTGRDKLGVLSVSIELDPKRLRRMSRRRSAKLLALVKAAGFNDVSIFSGGYQSGRMDPESVKRSL